ncbi:MAG: hypothetical protein AAFZ15_10755 [Bacteroidota bacterium]
MTNSKFYFSLPLYFLTVILLAALFLGSCQAPVPEAPACDSVTDIEGVYNCQGQCVITDSLGNKSLLTVSVESDTIQRFKGAKESLYQVNIGGAGGFHEIEIGPFNGQTLYTATANVTDNLYPVLEEYVFDSDADCKAVSFIKTVRNPTPDNFKACVIYCKKSGG